MITPLIGHIYKVKHTSGYIAAKFIADRIYNPPQSRYYSFNNQRRSTHHYVFINLQSGREIVIKSRVKIVRELIQSLNSDLANTLSPFDLNNFVQVGVDNH